MGRHRGERGCKGRDVAGEREAVEEREDVEESEAVKVIGREFFHLLICFCQFYVSVHRLVSSACYMSRNHCNNKTFITHPSP